MVDTTKKFLAIISLILLFFGCKQRKQKEGAVFKLMDSKAIGIDFENNLTYSEDFNIYLYKSFYNGAGVGMGDFNNDGLQDIFFSGNQVDNKLYINKGAFQFADATRTAGVGSTGAWSTGVSVVDINGDGWLDIYVCKSGRPESENRRNQLFIHTGVLSEEGYPIYEDQAKKWGVDDLGFSVNATFFDYDRDGDLDMYLLNNSIEPSEVVVDAKKGLRNLYDPNGGNKLYKNTGMKFIDVTVEAGIYGSAIGYGLGASVGDLDKDGWPDLYIANDFFEKDYLYFNNGDGTFSERITESLAEISQGAMGVDIADLNNDTWQDIFVTEMLPEGNERVKTKILFDDWNTYQLRIRNGYHRQFPRNTFQLNRGVSPMDSAVVFSEISRLTGTAATEWSWGVHLLDLNNDANKEIFITNGIVKDLLDQDYIDFYNNADRLRQIYKTEGAVIKKLVDNIPSTKVSNYLFEQEAGDLRFSNVTKKWGLSSPSFSTGASFGDLDNDGDLDLVVNNLNDKPFIYENETNEKNNYLKLQLKGNSPNTGAIGSKITIYFQDKLGFQEAYPVRGTMSSMDNRLHFGLGDSKKVDSIEIVWPLGDVSTLYDVNANQMLVVNESSTVTQKQIKTSNKDLRSGSVLREVTSRFELNYKHQENSYLDFDRDKLRYSSIATEGPRATVGDLNNDGNYDIFICGAKGQPSQLFLSTNLGGFVSIDQSVFELDADAEDVNAVFTDINGDGKKDLLVSTAGYEYPSSSFALANRVYLNNGSGHFKKSSQIVPQGNLMDTSCIVPADFDGDGDMDLFIGNRAKPLAYGVPADGFLLINDGKGNFVDETKDRAKGLKGIGMVTDAAWFDFDKDGDEDLVVVGEFMPIKLFENKDGVLTDRTVELGLDKMLGLWKGIEVKDIDSDGYLDLVVANVGSNHLFEASSERPLTLFVNDFDKNGAIDHVLCSYEKGQLYPIALKKDLTSHMPYLSKKFITHSEYAKASIQDIFSADQLEEGLVLKANCLQSVVLWNNSGSFEMKALPMDAQLTTNYAIFIDDFDNDGIQDILLGGNLFRTKPQLGIQAGSYGTYLKGMDKRKFESMTYQNGGFMVSGEIRDIKPFGQLGDDNCIIVIRNDDTPKIFEYGAN